MIPDHGSAAYCSQCIEPIRFCEQLLNHFAASIITIRELHYNTAIHLLATCDICMGAFLDSLPDPIAVGFDVYLQGLLESDGPLALVRPFIVGSNDKNEFRQKRSRIEPRVYRLCNATSQRMTRLRAVV
jgi:hypothetical protein